MNASRLSPAAANIVVPTIVGCALFMQTLDSTVIATALPVIARAMREPPIRLNLAITSYLLSLAVFIPISGWVADRYGARSVFRAAIALFTLGSIFCGLSSTLAELVLARVLQGFGGAMMVPVGRLVVLRIVPKSGLVDAMSYLTIPAVLGPVLGPPVGGFIVTYSSWRWIFFINVPIAILGMFLVTLYIPDIKEEETIPLDLRGFFLTGIGLAGLVFGFETIGRNMIPVSLVMTAMTMLPSMPYWLAVPKPSMPEIQPPTRAPIRPTTMSMMKPKPEPFISLPVSQPAMTPMMIQARIE